MTIETTALRLAAACLLFSAAPCFATESVSCLSTASRPRLVCDEGACVRVPVRDLCDAVRASYPAKPRAVKPGRSADTVRHELTLLIASVN